jgi:hypothetical protein
MSLCYFFTVVLRIENEYVYTVGVFVLNEISCIVSLKYVENVP